MEIEIQKKKIKNLRIKVEDGVIKVSAPRYMNKAEIYRIIDNNHKVIDRMKIEDKNRNRYKNHLFGVQLNTEDEAEIEKIYREELPKVLDKIFEKFIKLTGLKPVEYNIRKMKVRWGTCYPTRKMININLKLAERPIEQIEAVVLHELVHLKHYGHDEKFFKECEKYMPDYKIIERELKH